MTLLGLKRNIFESDTPKKKNIVKRTVWMSWDF